MLDDTSLASWCGQSLGAHPAGILFRSGHLAQVVGIRLTGGRSVVLKIRPADPRIAGCAAVQAHLAARGFPCPVPLAGPSVAREFTVTAETHIPGGQQLPATRTERCRMRRC